MDRRKNIQRLCDQLRKIRNPASQVDIYLELVKAVIKARRHQTLTQEEATNFLLSGHGSDEVLTAKSGTLAANIANEIFELALFELDMTDLETLSDDAMKKTWSKI